MNGREQQRSPVLTRREKKGGGKKVLCSTPAVIFISVCTCDRVMKGKTRAGAGKKEV